MNNETRQRVPYQKREMVTRTCQVCGHEFMRRIGPNTKEAGVYCSRACFLQRGRKGEYRQCKVCGTTFYLHPSAVRDPDRTGDYCSQACHGAARVGMKRPPMSNEWKAALRAGQRGKPKYRELRVPPQRRTCPQCGDVFLVHVSPRTVKQRVPPGTKVGHLNAICCSHMCRVDYWRANPEQSPNWRGGRKRHLYRYGPNWLTQSRRARIRDQYTCQQCGKVQRRPALHVHHITPYVTFKGDWQRANVLDNLLTLCASCHAKLPKHR